MLTAPKSLSVKNLIWSNSNSDERDELRIEDVARGTHAGVPENHRHITNVSLPSDVEDLRHAV